MPPWSDHKRAALSIPQICLQKLKMKDHASRLFKDVRVNKAYWKSQSNTHKLKWVLFLIVDYESCFFDLWPPFSSLIFLHFAFFAYAYKTRHVSSNFFPCWFLVSGNPSAWLFNSLLIPSHQKKKLSDVMVAYLLYRWKHLCMLKFRAVAPSLTKNYIFILHIAGCNNKSDSMFSLI